MGNIMTCWKINKTDLLLEKQCPYCKHFFLTPKEKDNHIKNCIHNTNISNMNHEFSIYSDPNDKL